METSGSRQPAPLRALPRLKQLMADLAARKAWETAHSELAAAWTSALAEDDAWTRAREAAVRQTAVAQGAPATLARLGVPKWAATAAAHPGSTPAMAAAKEWWLSGKAFLLLLGGVGSGKTTAAAWCLVRHLERAISQPQPSGGLPVDAAMFATAPEFNGLSDYNSEGRAWLDRLCRCQMLVLDDLGTERMGDGELSCVQRIVSERHASGRRTVLTSNLTSEVFRQRYGERVADRIREVGVVKGSGQQSLRRAP